MLQGGNVAPRLIAVGIRLIHCLILPGHGQEVIRRLLFHSAGTFEQGTLLDGEPLMEDLAVHNGALLQDHTVTAHDTVDLAANDDLISSDIAIDRGPLADDESR